MKKLVPMENNRKQRLLKLDVKSDEKYWLKSATHFS